MTLEVNLSMIKDQAAFDAAIAAHIAALTAFQKTKGEPRPVPPHPIVEQAIRRVVQAGRPDKYVPDYVVVNDIEEVVEPVVPLEIKKQQAFMRLETAERVAKDVAYDQRRIRLLQLNYADAMAKKPEDQTDADRQAIAEFADVQTKWLAIERKAAEAEAEIATLTAENADQWVPPDLT